MQWNNKARTPKGKYPRVNEVLKILVRGRYSSCAHAFKMKDGTPSGPGELEHFNESRPFNTSSDVRII